MTTPERRQVLYTKMLRFMTSNKLNTVPINLQALCQGIGVGLVPLSRIVQEAGLSATEVFQLWGNEDGAINAHNGKHRIAFNDGQPRCRIRFTICEEIAHMVYEHTQDPDFNMFQQGYACETYSQYDEEARLGAGFLICHPRFFYTHERFLIPKHLSEVCDISLPCATTRYEVYGKYKGEITKNITYQFTTIPHTSVDLWKYEKKCRLARLKQSS